MEGNVRLGICAKIRTKNEGNLKGAFLRNSFCLQMYVKAIDIHAIIVFAKVHGMYVSGDSGSFTQFSCLRAVWIKVTEE